MGVAVLLLACVQLQLCSTNGDGRIFVGNDSRAETLAVRQLDARSVGNSDYFFMIVEGRRAGEEKQRLLEGGN